MLNNASDYKFLKTADIGSFINGDIMPVVYPLKNTMATVRFEDYLFLLEGFYERMNVESIGLNNVIPLPRTIYGSNILASELRYTINSNSNLGFLHGASIGYASSSTQYINPNVIIPNSYVVDDYNYIDIDNFLTDQSFYIAAPLISDRPRSYSKSPLKAEYIRARYYDLNNAKKLRVQLSLGDIFSSGEYLRYDRNGSLTSTTPFNLSNTQLGLYYQTSVYNNATYLAYTTQHTYKDYFFNMPFATSAKLVYSSMISKNQNGSLESKYITEAKNLVVSNGNINVPNSLLDDIKQTALNASGWNLTASYGVSIYLQYVYLIIDFDFPASLNGINWNWTP